MNKNILGIDGILIICFAITAAVAWNLSPPLATLAGFALVGLANHE